MPVPADSAASATPARPIPAWRTALKRWQSVRHLVWAVRSVRDDVRTWRLQRGAHQRFAAYLAQTDLPRLHLGAGPHILPGWLNTDLNPRDERSVYLDATNRYPVSDGAFAFAFSEHLIEHLTYAQGQAMLGELFRVLRPGGVFRVATPNLLQIASLLTHRDEPAQRAYLEFSSARFLRWNTTRQPAYVVTNFFWDFGHVCLYDPTALTEALGRAGFVDIVRVTHHQSQHEPLRRLEGHDTVVGPEINAFETMIFEARRP